jgi:hypothetical protein
MSELSPDEPSIATAGAARIAELTRGGTDPVAERRRAFDRERKRRGLAKALSAQSQRAPRPLELRSRRLGARNHLIGPTRAVRLCPPGQGMFKQSTDNGSSK